MDGELMKIRINPLLFLFILYFYFNHEIQIYFLLMLFVLLHELGHMAIGILLKLKIEFVDIMPWGFSIKFQEEYDCAMGKIKRNIRKIMVALAGPAVNIILFIVMLCINVQFQELIYANILIAMFNLLPIYPLDGGRILEGILDMNLEYNQKNKYLDKIAKITMVLLTIAGSILLFYYKNILIFLGILWMWFIMVKQKITI